MLRPKIDINCDLGESFGKFKIGHDSEIMPSITSANVACGFHAGDPTVMAQTVKLAKDLGVKVGAHPGFPDLGGFGRRVMDLTDQELKSAVIYQVGALMGFATAVGIGLQHVKPHGALYNIAATDEAHAHAIVEAVRSLNRNLVLFALANSTLAKIATEAGLRVAWEVFADRAYNSDGSLVPRGRPGALIEDPARVADRAVKMITEQRAAAADGSSVIFEKVHTICVHSDTLNAVELAKALKKALLAAEIEVTAVGHFV